MASHDCPHCGKPFAGFGTLLRLARAEQIQCPHCGSRARAEFGASERRIIRITGAGFILCLLAVPFARDWQRWGALLLIVALGSLPIFAVLSLRSPLKEVRTNEESEDQRLRIFLGAGILVWYAIAFFVKASQLR